MPEQLITCPNCGNNFEVGDVLTESIREQLRRELEAEILKKEEQVKKRQDQVRQREKELAEREETIDDKVATLLDEERKKLALAERKRVEQEFKVQFDDLNGQVDEQRLKLEASATREVELLKKQREIEEREKLLELEMEKRINAERKQIAETAKKQAEESLAGKIRESEDRAESLLEQVEERDKRLEDAQKKEVEILRKERDLQVKERSMDLELERRLTEAQGKLYEEAATKAQDGVQLKLREKDDLIERLKGEMQQMQRRLEQGSQEGQGEALEGQLREALSSTFPFDSLEDVKKGARGADIIQIVRDNKGNVCGTILWEAKNTKTFQNGWVDKLKKDQQESGAAIAVIMTIALPSGIKQFGQIEEGGLWVTDYASSIGLCMALRQQLIRVCRERLIVGARETVKDVLFEYVTGQEFNLRVRRVADTYIQMQQDLESEKRVLQRQWKKREKQITLVVENIVAMRGELEGLIGAQASLPEIETLSLEYLANDKEDSDISDANAGHVKVDADNADDGSDLLGDDVDDSSDEIEDAEQAGSLLPYSSDEDEVDDQQADAVQTLNDKSGPLLSKHVSVLMLNHEVSISLKKSRIGTIRDIIVRTREELKALAKLDDEQMDYLQEKLGHYDLAFRK